MWNDELKNKTKTSYKKLQSYRDNGTRISWQSREKSKESWGSVLRHLTTAPHTSHTVWPFTSWSSCCCCCCSWLLPWLPLLPVTTTGWRLLLVLWLCRIDLVLLPARFTHTHTHTTEMHACNVRIPRNHSLANGQTEGGTKQTHLWAVFTGQQTGKQNESIDAHHNNRLCQKPHPVSI